VIAEPDKNLSNIRQSRRVPRKFYPMLVTFADINNPASVREVDPANLAKIFGAGYKLKSITLEITDEKVTKGVVEGVLGWMRNQNMIDDLWQNLDYEAKTAILGLREPFRR
jgi:hypothetical protein